jgi:arsenate reductase-like glutaredoxin family protein
MTCRKAQEFLAQKGITAKTTVNARKERLGADAALQLMHNLSTVVATKGKKIVRWHLAKDRPSRDDLLSVLLGPSGTLRAPVIRIGGTLLVGFAPAVYHEIFG